MHTESSNEQNAVSSRGAAGYMQLMPSTFRQFGAAGKNVFDPATNIDTGAAYLQYLSTKYDGSLDKVLAGYNAGPGNVDKYGGVPPFRETRNFVASVKRHYEGLRSSSASASGSTSRPTPGPVTTSNQSAVSASLSASVQTVSPAQTVASAQTPATMQSSGVKSAEVQASAVEGAPGAAINQWRAVAASKPESVSRLTGTGRSKIESRPTTKLAAADPSQPQIKFASTTNPEPSHASSVELHLPVQGRISSPFGARRPHGRHQGVDIAAPRGTPIEASAAGQVVFSGWSRGYGKTVLIEHPNGVYTRYAHADHLMVTPGETVESGQQVATVGSTGRATGPHVHFEVIQDGHHVNPLRMSNYASASYARAR